MQKHKNACHTFLLETLDTVCVYVVLLEAVAVTDVCVLIDAVDVTDVCVLIEAVVVTVVHILIGWARLVLR